MENTAAIIIDESAALHNNAAFAVVRVPSMTSLTVAGLEMLPGVFLPQEMAETASNSTNMDGIYGRKIMIHWPFVIIIVWWALLFSNRI